MLQRYWKLCTKIPPYVHCKSPRQQAVWKLLSKISRTATEQNYAVRAKGATRNEWSGRDFSSVTKIITKVNENVSPLSIRDLHRLGKYQEQSRRPRPILIKFKRAIDVSILLSKASTLPKGIRIKPDMNPEERHTESLLLKERWTLMQKEIDRKLIKIRGNKIFVNNKLHGEVQNRNFVLSQAVPSDDPMESSHT